MKKIFEKIIFSFFLLTILSSNSWSEIKFKEVVVSGIGQSLEEATQNAFAEAISMVNGKNVHTKTIIKVMSGDSLPKDKEASKENQNIDFLAKILIELNQSEESKKTKETKTSDQNKEKKVEYTQDYLKELIDETKGGIKSYKIIKKK